MTSAPDDSGDSQGPAHAFDEGVPTIPPPAPRRQAGSLSGRTIDGYHIGELIGEGGMGEVYVAEQRDPIRMKVAFKVIKAGLSTKDVLKRFDMERQALAVMNHPAICRVLNAGSTPEHRPYFVMEHVSGKRITEYCDDNKLPIRPRLELFGKVCEAVQHAHTKGIIHRDLKPSNVMVTEVDGKAVPKVIDFGVAKALNQPLTDATLMHEAGRMIGTLEYMSPEQAGGDPDIDTRADIYSLGVLLYELLTGAPPFPGELLRRKGYDEMRRIIREDAPPSPSTFYSRISTESQTAAARRAETVEHLAKTLRRELEWIPLYAVRKERGRRYVTAAEFGKDIDNYLAKKPLIAGPDSWWYRTSKTIRRNKGPVAAAAGIVLALLLGLAGTAWQMAEARAAEAQTREQRDEAVRRLVQFDETSRFFADIFAELEPAMGTGSDPSLLLTMVRNAEDRQQWNSTFPELRAGSLQLRGDIYQKLGDRERAGPRLREGLEISREVLAQAQQVGRHDDNDFELVRMMMEGCRRYADFMCSGDDHEHAEQLRREAVNMGARLLPEDHFWLAAARADLAAELMELGELDEAERLQNAALAELDGHPEFAPRQRAVQLANLAYLLAQRQKYTAAQEAADCAERLYIEAREVKSPRYAELLLNRSVWAERDGDRVRALEFLNRATAIHDEILKDPLDRRRILEWEQRVKLLILASDFEQASGVQLKVIAARQEKVPDDLTALAAAAEYGGKILQKLGRLPEAREKYILARDLFERAEDSAGVQRVRERIEALPQQSSRRL